MSKKSRKNLQKILAKRQQLQQINSSSNLTELLLEDRPPTRILPNETPVSGQLPAYSHNRELIRTVISISVIVVLLVGVVIFDRQRDDLETFGNWLYQALRLNK